MTDITSALQDVFTTVADEAARASGFVQRQSKLTGALFVQTLTFSYLSDPDATVDDLTQTAATLGLTITGPGIVQRCTKAASACLYQVLTSAVQRVIAADPTTIPLLKRFTAVLVQDSSTIVLPPELADIWAGCGGSTTDGDAALKLQLQFDVCCGALAGLELQDGRASDRRSVLRHRAIVADALYLADLGYFALARLRALAEGGAWWLTRLQAAVVLFDAAGRRWDAIPDLLERSADATVVDIPVTAGVHERLPCRLVAVRAPQEVVDQRRRRLRTHAQKKGKTVSQRRLALCAWTIFLTNVAVEHLSVQEILTLGRTRWQIELLFKRWKSHGKVDESRSAQPYRVLCDVYAKLLAMVVQHWLCLVALWAYPDRSLAKAARTVKRRALELASAFVERDRLAATVERIGQCLGGCRMNKRRRYPNTYQLLLDASLLGIGMPEGALA
jgi:hypothetical protein